MIALSKPLFHEKIELSLAPKDLTAFLIHLAKLSFQSLPTYYQHLTKN